MTYPPNRARNKSQLPQDGDMSPPPRHSGESPRLRHSGESRNPDRNPNISPSPRLREEGPVPTPSPRLRGEGVGRGAEGPTMTPLLRSGLLVAALMFAASAAAVALRPTHKLADAGPKVDLEAMIPKQFGDWRIDESIVPVLPSPDVQAKLDKIYNQTLARTYVNSRGQRIMLSIAYGGDQSDNMQVHLPEVCYAAQGFQINKASLSQIATDYGALPVKRLIATLNNRIEPVTYWITVGDQVVNASYKRKLAQLKHGITGSVPDGILVRASSIGRDEIIAYELQESFLRDLLAATSPAVRSRLGGNSGINE